MKTIPVFPLNTVLYPEGILPLRIFEPRYTDMVSECLKNNMPFGVCLISEGKEVGEPAEIFNVGTTARIIDWNQEENGLLGITTKGEQRFKLLDSRVRKNNLMEGDIVFLDHEEDLDLPVEYQLFSDLLRQIVEKFDLPFAKEHEKFNDPYWVGCRLAELLPVELNQKQTLLEMDDPINRLIELQAVIDHLNIEKEYSSVKD